MTALCRTRTFPSKSKKDPRCRTLQRGSSDQTNDRAALKQEKAQNKQYDDAGNAEQTGHEPRPPCERDLDGGDQVQQEDERNTDGGIDRKF